MPIGVLSSYQEVQTRLEPVFSLRTTKALEYLVCT